MQEFIEPKVVVITGASAGVGRATAKRFAKDKHKLALLARGKQGLEAAKAEVESLGGTAITIQCDVADYEQVDLAASEVEEKLGPIDIWINNAGAAHPESGRGSFARYDRPCRGRQCHRSTVWP